MIKQLALTCDHMPWDDENTKLLKQLFGERRWTCSEIARFIGGFTRNAVIGKLHRLGLRNTEHKSTTQMKTARQRKPRAKRGGAFQFNRPDAPKPLTPEQLSAQAPLPPTCNPVSLVDAKNNQCRYPLGKVTHDMKVCGAPTILGSSWCAYHYARCHTHQPHKV